MFGILDPSTEIAIVIGLMTAAALLLGVAAFAGMRSRRYTRRLSKVSGVVNVRQAAANPAAQRSLARRESATPGLDAFFRMLPRREMLVERLSRTGRQITVGQFGLATVGCMAVATILLMMFLRLGPAPSVMFGVAAGAFVPFYVVGFLGRRRANAFIGLFPEAIDLMVRALRAGLPISEAIVNAGQEIGDPVGQEFRGIEAGMRLGRDLDSLLWDIAKRIPAPEFRFFIIALSVQRETGGNLAETLNNLSDVLRRRRAMRAKARAMASEARASTAILGSLPVLVTVILMFTSPDYINPLFRDVRGLVLVGVAVSMLVGGIAVMVRMARFEI